jgi:legumain
MFAAGLLDPTLGIYATTAANAVESSWGTYCPPDDKVDGKELNSCLGDLYSVNWMQNADQVGKDETLEAQYTLVKKATNLSHVMQYGDETYTSDPIGDFLGDSTVKVARGPQVARAPQVEPPKSSSSVQSRNIPLHLAYYRYLRADQSDIEGRQRLASELQRQLTAQMATDDMFMAFSSKLMGGNAAKAKKLFFAPGPANSAECGECCIQTREVYEQSCGRFTDYSLQYVRVLTNACGLASTRVIVDVIKALCQ